MKTPFEVKSIEVNRPLPEGTRFTIEGCFKDRKGRLVMFNTQQGDMRCIATNRPVKKTYGLYQWKAGKTYD